MGLFDALKPKTRADKCDTCNGPLKRNHDQQVMKYCSDFCRKLRHNRKAKAKS